MKIGRVLIAAAAAVLTGCGGSGGSAGITPSAPIPTASPSAPVNAQFVVVVPAASVMQARVKPQYISAAARSVTIVLQRGDKLGAFDVSQGSSSCKSASGGGRTCTVGINAPAGNDTFVVSAYDQPGGAGNVLATGTIVQTVSSSATSTIAVDLTGVTASIKVSLNGTIAQSGTAASIPIVVQALDASGNTILGAYDRTITLTDSDSSGHTSLSVTSIIASGTAVALNYDGSYMSANAVISASAPGIAAPPETSFHTAPAIAAQYDLPPFTAQDGSQTPLGASGIVQGPDGNLWIAAATVGAIVKMTPDGKTTMYWPPTLWAFPQEEVVGKDGAIWFTERDGNNIGRVTTSGSFTEYPIPTQYSNPLGICVGPDGNIWFVEQVTSMVGRVNGDGSITEFALPVGSFPNDLTAGPDGNLWIDTNPFEAPSAILVMSTNGTLIATHVLANSNEQPYGIVAGPDGNLWFGEYTGGALARMTTSGELTEYATPSSVPGIVSLAVSKQGDIWFAESGAAFATTGQLGYITPGRSTIHEVYLNMPLHVRNITFDSAGALWYSGFYDPDSNVGKVIP
ncbi:MAG TPA: hypothetical protein VFH72_13425 [Candidatus Baltobacteraceae bacterium]|nr:hypothetical protein [Candidatus Baltobacteraceae bacterium]